MGITLYPIGQFAKLKGTSVETLRHYDRIGLLQPESTNDESLYRYYSYKQILRYDMIMCCKDIGMSLQEIKQMFHEQDSGYFISNIAKHRQDTIRKIKQLQQSIQTIDVLQEQMENALSSSNEEGYYIRVLPSRTYFSITCKRDLTLEQVELLYMQLIDQITHHQGTTMYAGGFLYDESIQELQCQLFECVQEEPAFFPATVVSHTFLAGKYLCKKHTHANLRDDLKDFIKETKRRKLPYEQIIDAYLIDGRFQSEYRTFELQVYLGPNE